MSVGARDGMTVVLVCLVSFLGATSYAQQQGARKQAEKENSSGGLQGLDSQLLEGVSGAGVAQETDGTTPDASQQGLHSEDGVVDPFARGSDVGKANPLVEIGNAMQRVEKRLRERQMAQETQRTQQEIVQQLDDLIEMLAAAQSSESRQQRKPSPGSEGEQSGKKTGRDAARADGGEQEQVDANVVPSAQAVDAVNQIWGHLPERFRQQVTSASAVEFLPKYRKLIEDYYQRLARDRDGAR